MVGATSDIGPGRHEINYASDHHVGQVGVQAIDYRLK
jgi:hypothetical protein